MQEEPRLRQVMIPGVRFYQTDFYIVNSRQKWQQTAINEAGFAATAILRGTCLALQTTACYKQGASKFQD